MTWNIRQRMFLYNQTLKKKVGPRFYPYSNVYIYYSRLQTKNARMMGFDALIMRPEYMMMKVLPVAPNTMRPMQEDFKTGKPMENDLHYDVFTSCPCQQSD